jgi:hypothetical protein
MIALFENFKCKCDKKLYIFKQFAKGKKIFMPISIILYLIPIKIPKKVKNLSPLLYKIS